MTMINGNPSVLELKFVYKFNGPPSSFLSFGKAQDKLQRDSSGPSKSWIPARLSQRLIWPE
jgi:hypothetical protein